MLRGDARGEDKGPYSRFLKAIGADAADKARTKKSHSGGAEFDLRTVVTLPLVAERPKPDEQEK